MAPGMTVIDDIYQEDKAANPVGHPRILALANQKGGVGKTTTAINLGTALAAIGERVLIVDLDPQGNASTGLGIDRRNRSCSTYDVLIGEAPLRDAVVPTAVPRLHIAASTIDLPVSNSNWAPARDRAFRLRNAIAALNANATRRDQLHLRADRLSAVAQSSHRQRAWPHRMRSWCRCSASSSRSRACRNYCRRWSRCAPRSIPSLSIHGIVLTMFDSRNNLSNQVVADVRQFMGDKVYKTMIPRNVRISEAPSYGKPVLVYDLKCVGSEAYLKLATEVIQRERELRAH